jgi:D-glycero-alpha-D-manno-heptose-7-phosphate kinase
MVNNSFDDRIRVSYSQTEIVDSVDEIRHPIVREALKILGIEKGIEITSVADIPAKTGLASSSVFTVGLLNALYAYKGIFASKQLLAEKACEIEINILGEPIGKQDQYAVAYGGLNYIQFNKDETVIVEPLVCSTQTKKKIDDNLIMFYTGVTRKTGEILSEQKKNTKDKNEALTQMRDMTEQLKKIIYNESDLNKIGELLDKNWKLKKELATKISTSNIDTIYKKAMDNGALGGKILGAGGGGFILFYCEKEEQNKLRNALSELIEIPMEFDNTGSRIVFVE